MANQNKLSRREAIKLLGAATGASLLASLPTKWSKPEVTGSALPAHAQTSSNLELVDCDFTLDISTGVWSSTPYIVLTVGSPLPLPFDVTAKFTITFLNTHFQTPGTDPQNPNPIVGNWTIVAATGSTSFINNNNTILNTSPDTGGKMVRDSGKTGGSVTILWESSYATGSCEKTVLWGIN